MNENEVNKAANALLRIAGDIERDPDPEEMIEQYRRIALNSIDDIIDWHPDAQGFRDSVSKTSSVREICDVCRALGQILPLWRKTNQLKR